MERDYGYVKVAMGPLFPDKRNTPTRDIYTDKERYPFIQRQLPQHRESRVPTEKESHSSNRQKASPNLPDKRHSRNLSDDIPHPRYVVDEHSQRNILSRPVSLHYSPSKEDQVYHESLDDRHHRGERVPPVVVREMEIREHENKQPQRSTTFYGPTGPRPVLRRQRHSQGEVKPLQRSPSKPRETSRPMIPKPDYGEYRSQSVDSYYRQDPERRRSEDRSDRYSHESRNDHSRHSPDLQKTKEDQNNLRIKVDKKKPKPHIPQPDYTWHKKKKKPSYDRMKY